MAEDVAIEIPEPAIVDDEASDQERLLPDVLPTFEISAYGADYPVDGLVKRLRAGDIDIPEFQRGFVWTGPQCARFIESLLLGLPVPGIFLYREAETSKLMVIDGQQRLRTLQAFYDGLLRGREFILPRRDPNKYQSIHRDFEGKTYASLGDEDRRRLDDSIIHATIVKQDAPQGDLNSVYHIFERINSGGTQLQPQEIRSAVFHGRFRDLLRELDQDDGWRAIYGPPSPRFKDQELILRFISLYHEVDEYAAPMTDFLNRFMSENRDLSKLQADKIKSLFYDTVGAIRAGIGERAFRPERALNAAVFDAVMVGVARRVSSGTIGDISKLGEAHRKLLDDTEFQAAYRRATANEDNVRKRIDLATKNFAVVP